MNILWVSSVFAALCIGFSDADVVAVEGVVPCPPPSATECRELKDFKNQASQLEELSARHHELRTALNNAEASKEKLSSELNILKKEKAVCDKTAESLFHQNKEIERVQVEAEKRAADVLADRLIEVRGECEKTSTLCEARNAKLMEQLNGLDSCQKQVVSLQATGSRLDECRASEELLKIDLKNIESSLRNEQDKFQSQIEILKRENEELNQKKVDLINDKKELNSKIDKLNSDFQNLEKKEFELNKTVSLIKSQSLKLEKELSNASYTKSIYSTHHFIKNGNKVLILSTTILAYISSAFYHSIPEATIESLSKLFAQLKLECLGYRNYFLPQIQYKINPLLSQAHLFYFTKVRPGSQAIQTYLSNQYKQHDISARSINMYEFVMTKLGLAFDSKIVRPFISKHPEIAPLIPDSNTDRFIAILYVIAVLYLFTQIIRLSFRLLVLPIFKLLGVLLLLLKALFLAPWKIAKRQICYFIQLCKGKFLKTTASTANFKQNEVPKEDIPKKKSGSSKREGSTKGEKENRKKSPAKTRI